MARLRYGFLGLALACFVGLGALPLLPAATDTDSPLPEAGYYRVRPGDSYVGYRIHKWGLVPVRGHFSEVAGELYLDPGNPEASWVRVRVPVASLESGNATRTEVLLSDDFFHAERFPEMRFESRAVALEANGAWRVSGLLTIRGISLPVTVPVTIEGFSEGGRGWAIFGTRFHLDRRDYDVLGRRWSAGRAILGNEVEIELALAAQRSGSA